MQGTHLHLQINHPIDRFTSRYGRFIARLLIATGEYPTLAEMEHRNSDLFGFGPFAMIEFVYPGNAIHHSPNFEEEDKRETVNIYACAYFRHRKTPVADLIQMSRNDCPNALVGLRLYALSASGPASIWGNSTTTREFLPAETSGMIQVMRYAQEFPKSERAGIHFDSVARGNHLPQFANQIEATRAEADPRAHSALERLLPPSFDCKSIAA